MEKGRFFINSILLHMSANMISFVLCVVILCLPKKWLMYISSSLKLYQYLALLYYKYKRPPDCLFLASRKNKALAPNCWSNQEPKQNKDAISYAACVGLFWEDTRICNSFVANIVRCRPKKKKEKESWRIFLVAREMDDSLLEGGGSWGVKSSTAVKRRRRKKREYQWHRPGKKAHFYYSSTAFCHNFFL